MSPPLGPGAASPKVRKFRKQSIEVISTAYSRTISTFLDDAVSAHVGAHYSFSTGVMFTMNMVLGTGLLTLPYTFGQAGFLLGAAFLALCVSIAYITTTFVAETLVLANAAFFEDAQEELLKDSMIDGHKGLEDSQDVVMVADKQALCRPDKLFKIRERIELGEMGHRILPNGVHQALYMFLFLHSFGSLCVFAVALVTCVEALIPNGNDYHGAVVIGFICLLFPLGFSNVQKLQKLQTIIILLRVLTVIAMITGALITYSHREPDQGAEIGKGWMWMGMPMAEPSGLPCMFANAVLAFMVHHVLPGLLAPLEVQADAPKVVATAYGIAFVIYLVLGFTALLAFGSEVPALYNLAFNSLPIPGLGTFLCAYPLTIVGSYPLVVITLRNNLLNALGLPPPDGSLNPKDIIATASACLPPLVVAYLTSDVQKIVGFFAGYFGLTLMVLVPCILVRVARHQHPAEAHDYPLRSPFARGPIVAFVVLMWALAIVFNTYRLFFMG